MLPFSLAAHTRHINQPMEARTNTTEQSQQARLLTPNELALLIEVFREMRQWSQEQLAAISGLNVRTIQRAEKGEPASLDTRRALARAFEFEDIDALSEPFMIPTEDDLKAAKEKFDRDHITLTATPMTTGKQLAKLAESCTMDLSEPAFALTREADEAFATLVDYFRDYRDCADAYMEMQKFEMYVGKASGLVWSRRAGTAGDGVASHRLTGADRAGAPRLAGGTRARPEQRTPSSRAGGLAERVGQAARNHPSAGPASLLRAGHESRHAGGPDRSDLRRARRPVRGQLRSRRAALRAIPFQHLPGARAC
ncbi:helix-turn-helix domain-containing protein [Paraburkholderia terricola]|uniref:helix-turn-helix transcriptional regulator n=1 Tax=Paraburkholderia terricola TaxID=169427 RepID=UPI001D0CBC14